MKEKHNKKILTDDEYYQKYRRNRLPGEKWYLLFVIILIVLLKIFNRI